MWFLEFSTKEKLIRCPVCFFSTGPDFKMAINSPGSFGSQISPKPHTPKSPRHFVFPQKSPSVVSSGSSGYYTPQSGCSYDRSPNAYCKPPKSPKIVNLRSPKSPRQFDFGSSEQSSPVLECPYQMPPRSPSSTTVSSSPILKSFKKTHKVRTPPVHIHTNPGYVSPSNCSSRCNSNSTLNKKSPYSSSNNLNENDRDSERSVRRCRKSTSDLTEETDDTPMTKSTSLSRPCSPMRRGSMKGGLAYLASRRGSRDSAASNCSKEDIGPLNFQNTVRGRQRRTSNFLELPGTKLIFKHHCHSYCFYYYTVCGCSDGSRSSKGVLTSRAASQSEDFRRSIQA